MVGVVAYHLMMADQESEVLGYESFSEKNQITIKSFFY